MRRVVINGEPPVEWIAKAEAAHKELKKIKGEKQKQAFIKNKEALWRQDAVRDWLLKQFNNKCWYSEAQDSVSSLHIEHYRPKSRVKDLSKKYSRGYWWLAFNWRNYRIAGQRINAKKSDYFPLSGKFRASIEEDLDLESPVLIDPTTDQTRLISYGKRWR